MFAAATARRALSSSERYRLSSEEKFRRSWALICSMKAPLTPSIVSSLRLSA